jgi:hypothetical protein
VVPVLLVLGVLLAVATVLLGLARRHVAVAPALLLPLVPSRRAVVAVVVPGFVTVAVVVAVPVMVAVVIAILMPVTVVVAVVVVITIMMPVAVMIGVVSVVLVFVFVLVSHRAHRNQGEADE